MKAGQVIAARFEIERLVGSGGMGEVYRARDRETGFEVAVKELHGQREVDLARFMREAEVLSELHHPNIVRYVTHGTGPSGRPYLAMEWLSGEDLGTRLERAPLTVDETITLIRRAAEALAAVHARGIIHRDLKPSNLFLVERDVARLKLLDFGIARRSSATRVTETGIVLGTIGYMAPEQVRSAGEVDARADVFALGCVLFECLTGSPPFTGDHPMAILGKILFDEVPSVREIQPLIPVALDALCARMLSKDPRDRLPSGAAALAALQAVGHAAALSAPNPPAERASVLTRNERRVLSVVMMGPEAPPEQSAAHPDTATQIVSTPEEVRALALAHGAAIELMADGSIMVTLVGTGVATDQAARAARCALALRAETGRPMALSTGRAEVSGRLSAGDLIDRAVRMLVGTSRAGPPSRRKAPIAIDEVTAGLLDVRFEVVETEAGLWLEGDQAPVEGARTLLGKPTACVGRDRELENLRLLLAECVEEPTAHAVLITAPAGTGKTRLATELLRRVRQDGPPVSIWIGRGDPLRAGSAFGLLGQALLRACGIQDGEPVEVRRDKLLSRVKERIDGPDAQRVAEFLGEIVGTPFPDEDSVPLRAARSDTQLMGDQTRLAWLDFLGATCAHGPLLLVLEDLHFGDLPTVRLIDVALRTLRDKPWMVVALARPEVHDLFPKLWADRSLHEIRLPRLSRKASARLARQVLGDGVPAETIDRLVAQAEGNAFTLEELIRAAAEGRTALPETALSMVQSRLEGLDSGARRVLRAGSVFGDVFWRGAVLALLGGDAAAPALLEELSRLEHLEWVSARAEARFKGERELVFRHALVREAAYGMLTDEDRALGHRLAGAWLERASEPSAAVIAEHFDRGGDPARASACYLRAAEQALAGNDFGAALAHIDRAEATGGRDAARGELALLRAQALRWRGEIALAERSAREAMDTLPKGSASWYAALAEVGVAAIRLVQHERLAAIAADLAAAWSGEPVTAPAVVTNARVMVYLLSAGLLDRAEEIHARIQAVAGRFADDPVVGATVFRGLALREHFKGSLGGSRALAERALRCCEQTGDLRVACGLRANLGFWEYQLGCYPESVALLRAAVADSERMGLGNTLGAGLSNLGLSLSRLGQLDEARAVVLSAIAALSAQGDQRMEGTARAYLAWILQRSGDLGEAEAEARRAAALLSGVTPLLVWARATLADVLLERGRLDEALAEAREAMTLLAQGSKVEDGEALARVVYAEALHATGDGEAARAAIGDARARLLAVAARVEDERRRKTFLENVPENARTLALARAWLERQTV